MGDMNTKVFNQNTFYVQYTALMLIIITFIVGTFLRPGFLGKSKTFEVLSVINIREKEILNIEESSEDFFRKIPVYSNILREHNLKGEINLTFNENSEDENLLNLENEIKLRFQKENINIKAINIFFREGSNDIVSFKIIRTNEYEL